MDIPNKRQREFAEINANREGLQRKKFLEKYFIAHAAIEGIGSGLKAVLASYGIETAADITRQTVIAVPGFGSKRTNALLSWRQSLESRFCFNPNQGIDPALIEGLNRKFEALKQQLQQALLRGPQELEAISRSAMRQREIMRAEIQRASLQLAQAQADVRVI